MKRLILSIIISSISLSAIAGGIFNMSIPQPDFVSNDWDNDGIPNSTDMDDDGDGILDENDSVPFGQSGQSSTPDVIVKSFSSDKISYLSGENITLSWKIENIRSLNLYGDETLTDYIGDVTNQESIIVTPIGDATYYLDTQGIVSSTSVFEYIENNKSCNAWSPTTSTITSGTEFTQTRSCNVNYSSNEPSSITSQKQENQLAIGTYTLPQYTYFPFSTYVYGPQVQVWDYTGTSNDKTRWYVPGYSLNGAFNATQLTAPDGKVYQKDTYVKTNSHGNVKYYKLRRKNW